MNQLKEAENLVKARIVLWTQDNKESTPGVFGEIRNHHMNSLNHDN